MPKISVIIPAYNIENELPRCLDSVLRQTFHDLEIIVIDDGSTDNTRSIIEKYSDLDERITPIYKSNGGVSSARFAGIKIASGDYIGFVDGDDIIDPEMYQILYDNAQKYDADISHCGYKLVFEDGRVRYFYNTERTILEDNLTGLTDLLEGGVVEPGLWNKLYKKELFRTLIDNDVMSNDIKYNEDLLINFFLFLQSKKSIFFDICPYHYIVRMTSATRKKLNRNIVFDPIKVRSIILDNSPSELKHLSNVLYINSCVNSCNSVVRSGLSSNLDLFKKAQALLREKKEDFGCLSKKHKLMAYLILYIPRIYAPLYRFYINNLSKNPFE